MNLIPSNRVKRLHFVGIGGAGMANDDLDNLLGKVDLAREGTLAQGHMQQRAHFAHDHRAERAFERDPEAAGPLLGADRRPGGTAGKEAGGSLGELQLVIIPEKNDTAALNLQPDPLIMRIQRILAFFHHKSAGRMNPGAAGLGETAGFVRSLHREGRQLFRNRLEQIGFHGASSDKNDQI